MLPRLREEGHKVLIFSQMTKLLDILEDYLTAVDFTFVRFDGTTKREDRQKYIDRFNDESQDTFIFLLSTRSGGLGINLTAADTVSFTAITNFCYNLKSIDIYIFLLLFINIIMVVLKE